MRRGRALLATIALSIAPANARFGDNQNVVAPDPMIAVPDTSDISLGVPVTIKAKQTILTYRLRQPPKVHLTASQSFSVSGLTFSLTPGDTLTRSLADYRMRGLLKGAQHFYCTERQVNLVAVIVAPFLSKFGPETRACLIDRDGDQRFEEMFFAGTKNAEDRSLRPISPIAFEPVRLDAERDERLELSFWGYPPLSTSNGFNFELVENGKRVDVGQFLLNSGAGYIGYPMMTTTKNHKGVVQYPVQLGSTRFTVLARDTAQGTITIRFDALPKPMAVFVVDRRSRWVPNSVPYWRLDR